MAEKEEAEKKGHDSVMSKGRLKFFGNFKHLEVTYSKCVSYYPEELKEKLESLERNGNEIIHASIVCSDGLEREVCDFDEVIKIIDEDVEECALSA